MTSRSSPQAPYPRKGARIGALLLLAALLACTPSGGGTPDAGDDAPDAGGDSPDAGGGGPDGGTAATYVRPLPVEIPPAPPPPDYSRNPRDAQGQPIVIASSRMYLVPRPPDAITALGACSDMITRCFDPQQRRSFDACVISTPRCTTERPWQEPACCSEACITDYEARRTAGVGPLTAFTQTFFGTPNCMPGVDALLGGE